MKRRRSSSYSSNKRAKFSYEHRPRQSANNKAVSERKYIDSFVADQPIASPFTGGWGSANCSDPAGAGTLFAPVPGNDINTRIGKKIQMLKVTVKGSIYVGPSEAPGPQTQPSVRLILVQNLQTNGIQAAPGELIGSSSASGSGSLYCFQNTNFFGKYKILKDKVIRIPTAAAGYTGTKYGTTGVTMPFVMSYKFKKPTYMHFSGTAGDVASIVQNSLHFISACDLDQYEPELWYRARLIYYDT